MRRRVRRGLGGEYKRAAFAQPEICFVVELSGDTQRRIERLSNAETAQHAALI